MLERLLDLVGRYPLDYVAAIAGSLPLTIGLIRYPSLTRPLRWLLLFFLMYLVGDMCSVWLAMHHQPNLFIMNIYPILGTPILSAVYYAVIGNKSARWLITGTASLLIVWYLAQFEASNVSYAESAAYGAYVTGLVLLYFGSILTDLRVKNILLHSMFWISAALIIYMAGTFFIFLFNRFIFDPLLVDDEQFDKYWNLNNVLYILMMILAAVGLWVSKYDRDNLI